MYDICAKIQILRLIKKSNSKTMKLKHGIVLQRDAFKIDTKPRQIYNFLLQL